MYQPVNTSRSDGDHAAEFVSAASVTGRTLSFHNIRYTVQVKTGVCKKTEKNILNGITGVFKPGMNAIMGPTGSGKTSMLNVLSARNNQKGISDQVLVDGKPQPSEFRLMSGYVVQENAIMETLSVRENLTFSAALRLPMTVNKREREQRVNDVISELALEDCAETKIGGVFGRGLSGGEKKRTNLGMELITQPSILFLDEPTTGLDATTAAAIISILARLSQRGRNIIFSIHQPRYGIFRLFDKLHLLSKGDTVYHGPAEDAVQYFSSNGYVFEEHGNPADFILDSILLNQTAVASLNTTRVAVTGPYQRFLNGYVEGQVFGAQRRELDTNDNNECVNMKKRNTPLSECFHKSDYYTDMTKEADSIYDEFKRGTYVTTQKFSYHTSFLAQLGYVGKRAFFNYTRNVKTGIQPIVVAVIYALVIGTIFFQLNSSADTAVQDRTGAFAVISVNMILQNTPSVDTFISERAVFLHELASGYYRTSAFFAAKILADLIPQRTVPVLVYASIVYWMIGLRPESNRFLIFTFNLLLLTYAVVALFFVIGICCERFFNAVVVIAMINLFQLLFSGFLINVSSIPAGLSWLAYLSLIRYNFKVLYINEYSGKVFCNPFPDNSTCLLGDSFLENQGIDATTWELWKNELVIGIVFVCSLLLAYILLRRINKFR